MKRWLLPAFMATVFFPAHAADLIRVAPVTNKIIMLQFDDGYIKKHGYHESSSADVAFLWPLNTELADNIRTYSISSSDDEAYTEAQSPLAIGRKSKGHDFSELCKNWTAEPWPGAACKNDYASYHYIYLELPAPMVSGKHYTIRFGDLAGNMEEFTLLFDEKATRSDAIHVNEMGYAPQSQKKFAYISQWMGTLGPFTDDALAGRRFDLYKLGGDGLPANSVYNGTVTLQHAFNQPDNNRSNETPFGNYVVSDVYQCDFSDFSDPGEYMVSVEGVGCSFPFRIDADAYQEAFYAAMKGLIS